MKQVVIKEDELQKIINESIKKRINELSSELLHKAALKAGQKAFDAHKSGDDKQGMRKMKQAGNLSKGSDVARQKERK